MINACLGSNGLLINCSCRPLVDIDALCHALDTKKIAGCALDTTDPEPLPDPHPLRGRENVIITPTSLGTANKHWSACRQERPLKSFVLSGEWPVNVVKRAVKGKNLAGP